MSRRTACLFNGFLWIGLALFLFYKGLHRISFEPIPWKEWVIFPFLGTLKGYFVLQKVAKRKKNAFFSSPEPLPWKQFFSWSYLFLLGGMMGLGLLLKKLPIPSSFLGWIDLSIAFALFLGAFPYFFISSMRRKTRPFTAGR